MAFLRLLTKNEWSELLKIYLFFSWRQRVWKRRVLCAGRVHSLRRLHQVGVLHHWDGPAPTGDTQGGQANGHSGRGRPSLTATQVRLLHEGHRQDVPLSFTRENHSVPGAFQQIHSQNFPVYDNYQTPLVKVWSRKHKNRLVKTIPTTHVSFKWSKGKPTWNSQICCGPLASS